MSKRPSLGPESVVRKSRLATKGEAVPALIHGRHGHEDQPGIPPVPVVVPVAAPVLVPVVEVVAAQPTPAGVADVPAPVVVAPAPVAEACVPVAEVPPALDAVAVAPVAPPESVPALEPVFETASVAAPEVPAAVLEAVAESPACEAVAVVESPVEPAVVKAVSESLPPVVSAPVPPVQSVHQPVVDGLLASLAEKDRLIAEKDRLNEQLRASLLRVEQERLQERAVAAREQEQTAGNLVAADATVDELRNRVGDLRAQLEASRAEVSRLIEHHGAERQRLHEHHKAECERLVATVSAARQQLASPVAAALDSSLQSAKRWLFGDEPQQAPRQPSAISQRLGSAQQRSTAAAQKQAPPPAPAKPSVVKPLGPPTAPKILNRRPVG